MIAPAKALDKIHGLFSFYKKHVDSSSTHNHQANLTRPT